MISNNDSRVGKVLKSSHKNGELVKLNCYNTGKDEAEGIGEIIENNLKKSLITIKYQY